jgi:hypothetical protein
MTKKKQVLLSNCEGHQYYSKYETAWSDTWVTFKKGKKTVKLGPTIVSVVDHNRDEVFNQQFHDEHPEYETERRKPAMLPESGWDFCCPFFDEGKWLPHEKDGAIPTIVVRASGLNKERIESAVEWFLRAHHGVTAPINFRWKNRKKKFFITPVSFGEALWT